MLGVALLVAALVYFLQESGEAPEATYNTAVTQLHLDPARIVRIDIGKISGLIRLEKIRGEWRLTEPVYASADDDRVNMLRTLLDQFRLTGMVSTNAGKQSVFEVDDAGTSLVCVSDDGKTLSLIIGKDGPMPGSAFVRMSLSDTVYLAQGISRAALEGNPVDWRQRTVYAASHETFSGLVINASGRRIALRRSESGWLSEYGAVPFDVAGPVVTALARIRAEAFIDTPVIIRARPRFEVEITGSDPVKMEFYSVSGDTNLLLKTTSSPSLVTVKPMTLRGIQKLLDYVTPPEPRVVQSSPPVVTPPPSTQPPVTQSPSTRTSRSTPQKGVVEPTTPARQPSSTQDARPLRPNRRVVQPAPRTYEDEGDLTVHKVKVGETISTIARRYDVSVEQIRKWNGMTTDNVSPGMELYVFVKRR